MQKSSREAEKKCTEVLLNYSPTFTVTALNCTSSQLFVKLFAVPAHWSEIDQRSELHAVQHGTLGSRFFHRNVSKTGPGVDRGSGAFTQTAWEQERPILGSSRLARKHGRNLLSRWERERERKTLLTLCNASHKRQVCVSAPLLRNRSVTCWHFRATVII